jgi:adenylate cyclase class 2
MNDLTETEVKLYCPDLDAVAARLAAVGATLTAPRVFEQNVRYEDADATLGSRGIVLRLRQDQRARLTYKEGASARDGIVSRREAEVEVSDFDTMDFILGRLGYTPAMRYEKYRATYSFGGVEVVLDELPYGNFIEIEGEHAAIEAAIAALGLNDRPRIAASYVHLFDHLRAALSLTFIDLTFEHFAGLSVPASAITELAAR